MNEILLFLTAFASVIFILVSWKLGKERLYSAIIIFLLLITTVGGKTVEFFGFETNTGNIFYASVFLATYFLIERFGRHEGIRSIWIGTTGVVFFLIFLKITLALVGANTTLPLSEALGAAFKPSTQVAFASLLAYILSQSLNVYLYIMLKEKMRGTRLWLRANIANALAQILDSAIFFGIAFWEVALPGNMFEIIAVSLVIKIGYMMIASPILYLNTIEFEERGKYSTISIQ